MLFWIGVIFILVVPVYIGIFHKAHPAIVWAAVLCGAFVIFISKIESIQELSLGPLRARMKEQIREADATIKQLREISAVSSEATLTNLMAGNFWGGMPFAKRLELHDKIVDSLKQIGASDAQIKRAESDWKKGVSIIYHNKIQEVVEQRKKPSQINSDAPEEAKKAGNEIKELLDFNNWAAPTPQQIKSTLRKYNINSPEAEAWIEDYEYFLKTGEIRNKEQFIKLRSAE